MENETIAELVIAGEEFPVTGVTIDVCDDAISRIEFADGSAVIKILNEYMLGVHRDKLDDAAERYRLYETMQELGFLHIDSTGEDDETLDRFLIEYGRVEDGYGLVREDAFPA